MSGQRSGRLLLNDTIEAAERLVELRGRGTVHPLGSDRTRGEGVLFNIIVMGEAVKRLPPEIVERFDDVPWKQLARTRNRIIHHYEGVDWAVVESIIDVNLPTLIPRLREIRDTLEAL